MYINENHNTSKSTSKLNMTARAVSTVAIASQQTRGHRVLWESEERIALHLLVPWSSAWLIRASGVQEQLPLGLWMALLSFLLQALLFLLLCFELQESQVYFIFWIVWRHVWCLASSENKVGVAIWGAGLRKTTIVFLGMDGLVGSLSTFGSLSRWSTLICWCRFIHAWMAALEVIHLPHFGQFLVA